MIELDRRMQLRLSAIITLKKAIMPGFCESQGRCDRTCPLFKSEFDSCYWMNAITAIDELETILCGYGYELKHDAKPVRSTKEQSRFDDIL